MSEKKNPIATITMDNNDIITLELYPDKAPESVNNFIHLSNSKFYDGVILHRIIKGFVLQGGDPDGTGMGGPGYSIVGEFKKNGHDNDITHTEGVISMARSASLNSGGSQFFLVVGNAKFLDNEYAGFGKVANQESMDVCMMLSNTPTGGQDRPLKPPVISSIRVQTHGVEYPEPNRL